jgi:TolB-like protein/Flp pilus assembly protein TadD
MGFIEELKRRNVIRMAGLYLVGAWLVVQVASTLLPMFAAPAWAPRSIVIALAIGFVPALVFAWVFELTPEGLKRDADVPPEQSIAPQTAERMNRIIVAVLLLALVYFGFDKFVLAPHREAAQVQAATQQALSVAQAAPAEKSIAVLPFVDMSQAKDQEYFSDGIAEELLNRLAQVPGLRVAARTSAFRFKGRNLDMADIGRQLKVAHLLEGSVRKEGDRLRITAQLIDGKSGYHLWSQTYERDAADVFQVQDEIAGAIATALEAKLVGRSTPAPRVDPEAYDDYLQGRALVAKRVGDNTRLAVEAFDRAIARDPGYSPAHSGRAFALTIGSYWGDWLPREQAFAQANASIEEALRLDPGNAEAFMVRGVIEATSLHIAAGKADFDRALALAPGNVDVINFYGDFQQFTADLRGSEAMKLKAIALDPLAFIHPINLGQTMVSQGRLAEALKYTQRGVVLGQAVGATSVWGNVFLMQARAGNAAEVQRIYEANCTEPAPEELQRCRVLHVIVLAVSGRAAEAERELAPLAAEVHEGKPLVQVGGIKGYVGLANLYLLALHDPHRAASEIRASLDGLQWFGYDKLLVTPQGQKLPEEISTDPEWLSVWADPRLKEFMDAYRANLARFRSGG